MDLSIYKNKKILVTGHSGFKGSWLCLLLQHLGAEVIGYSKESYGPESHFELLKLELESIWSDVRDFNALNRSIQVTKPDFIFHLAAQPLVRRSYRIPVETHETNIMGTVNILEAIRCADSVIGLVNVTTDKCYLNNEDMKSFKESDALGGYDPYSASKACSEIVTESYRKSFFNEKKWVASARAGNVIGGGDWSEDRLIPDLMRAISKKQPLHIRSPNAIRPWQHVLDPLFGYLLLGKYLLEKKTAFAEAWNFGPSKESDMSVNDVLNQFQKFNEIVIEKDKNENPHEMQYLRLDSSKSELRLGWIPLLNSSSAVAWTSEWYESYIKYKKIISIDQLKKYLSMCGC